MIYKRIFVLLNLLFPTVACIVMGQIWKFSFGVTESLPLIGLSIAGALGLHIVTGRRNERDLIYGVAIG